jgi:anti-sigma B factor antagonist
MSTKLRFRSETPDAETRIFRLLGMLHGTPEGYAFQEEVRNRFAEGAHRIVIDLAKVDHVDSSGIGIFATLAASAQNAQAHLALAALPPRVEQVMKVVRILDVIEHAPTVEEALARLDAKDRT